MNRQEAWELLAVDVKAYMKACVAEPMAFVQQIIDINSNDKIIPPSPPPKKRIKVEKPPKVKPPPKPDPRPIKVSKLKPNEKYCQNCSEVFVSNGWTITCPLCSASSLGYDDRIDLLYRDEFTCIYCGKALDDGVILHLDHVVPVSKGGNDVAGNLITACQSCNSRKIDHPLLPDQQRAILAIVKDRNELHGIPQDRAMKISLHDAEERREKARKRRERLAQKLTEASVIAQR